ncbi:MAG: VWA domain-containing protein [Candidatus Gracilibacteria bacterium]|nr:VWA domain-containing protein [Candidatus Gracilibacteria bacterium]
MYIKNIEFMDFLRLDILHIIPAILFVVVIIWVVFWRGRASGAGDESKNYAYKTSFSRIRLTSLVIAIILLAFAFLGPISSIGISNTERQGVDLVWILDVSKSMDVQDVSEGDQSISRLTAAKKIIENFILTHPENCYGLVVFAGGARLVSPLTSESESVLTFLTSIDSTTIRDGGTDFREALNTAIGRIPPKKEDSPLSLVLLSDGGEKENLGDTTMISSLFAGKNVTLSTIGIGSDKGGPIPMGQDPFGNTTYKLFGGEMVTSGLESDNLKSLADIGKGSYISGEHIGSSLDKTISKIQRRTIVGSANNSGDSGRVLVMIASAFFLIFLLIPASFLKKGNE